MKIKTTWNNLAGGSPLRLAALRQYVDRWNVRLPGSPITWRVARGHDVASIESDAHGLCFAGDGRSAGLPLSVVDGWRDCGASDDIVSSLPRGWYCDDMQDETISGHVWQLPARDGVPQYVAGYVETNGEYVCLDCTNGRLDVYTDKDDAARAADSLAERDAERERERAERWSAACELDDKISETCDALRDARADFSHYLHAFHEAARKGAKEAAAICSDRSVAARERFAELAEELRGLRDQLEDYADIER